MKVMCHIQSPFSTQVPIAYKHLPVHISFDDNGFMISKVIAILYIYNQCNISFYYRIQSAI